MSYAAGDPPYRVSEPTAPTTGGANVFVLAASIAFTVVLWLAVAFQTLVLVPKSAKMFLDFKMRLPLATEWIMHNIWWFAPLCLIASLLPSLLLCILPRSRWAGLALIVLAPLVLNLVIIASLYLPYAELIDGLGGGPKKN